MELLVFSLFLLFAFAGLLTLVFGIPGNFIILLDSFLFSWYLGFQGVTVNILIVLLLLAVLGEIFEFMLGIAGAKKYRSGNRAVVASILFGIAGAIIGAPLFFGIGSVIGAFIGAFAGAFIVEFLSGKGVLQAFYSGWGTFVGRVGGTVLKSLIGFTMIVIVVFSYINY